MNSAITPDIQQSIMYTLYFTFFHNYEAIAYFSGMLIGLALSIWKPSRYSIFIMIGFAILLFSFEYDKHIITAFRDQTLTALATTKPHLRFNRIVSSFITELLPVLLYVTGWAFVYISIIAGAIKMHGKAKK